MTYAIFSTGRPRVLHAVRTGETATVCGYQIGRGTGMVRDGNYSGSIPCVRGCWSATKPQPTKETTA